MELKIRNAPVVETPKIAVCDIETGEDVAWFFSLKKALEYTKLMGLSSKKNRILDSQSEEEGAMPSNPTNKI
jgi:hypothetical protein